MSCGKIIFAKSSKQANSVSFVLRTFILKIVLIVIRRAYGDENSVGRGKRLTFSTEWITVDIVSEKPVRSNRCGDNEKIA